MDEIVLVLREALKQCSGLGNIERMVLESLTPDSMPNDCLFSPQIKDLSGSTLTLKQVRRALRRLFKKGYIDNIVGHTDLWYRDGPPQLWEEDFWDRSVELALKELITNHQDMLSKAISKMKKYDRTSLLAILLHET